MQSLELLEEIQKFKSISTYLAGIVAIDNLPTFLKLKHFLIINTDTSNGNGKHWFCLIKVDRYKYEIFDSLGFSDEKKQHFLTFLKFSSFSNLKFKYNISQLQSNESQSCGLFVLYFLINRMHNFDMKFDELLDEIFTSNPTNNEKLVQEFKENFLT